MFTIAIPVRDEAPTIGVLLWRLRAMFQDYPREYDVVVYDDASSDGTSAILEPYTKTLPLTVLRGEHAIGYARSVDRLLREAAKRTRYPRRDAIVLMQGDFTDLPEHIPELVRRFEGGADVVLGERVLGDATPLGERRLRRVAGWLAKPLVAGMDIQDPFGTYRLIRLSTVRDLLKAHGDSPVITHDAWGANLELLLALRPHARRIESVALTSRYDLRPRESRRRPLADALALFRSRRALRRLARPIAG